MKLFTRYRILNATRALVAELGVERVTMRGIASLANITAPAIYKHFRNKRALLDEVIALGFSELDQTMKRGLRTPTPERGLRVMVDQAVDFALRHERLFEMMMSPRARDDRMVQRLQHQLARCRVTDAAHKALVLWGQIRGQLTMCHDGGPERIRWLYHRSVEPALAAAA